MNTMEDCVQLPELIDIIISFLDHNDQITCLRVNSVWYKQVTRQIFRWSIKCLQEDNSPQLSRLQACKDAQEVLKRNLALARDVKSCNPAFFELLHSSNALVNLVTLDFRAGYSVRRFIEKLLDITQRNLGLRSLILQNNFYFRGPLDSPVGDYVPILKSLANLTHLEFEFLTFFPLTDIKLLLDSLPKKSLKSLRMMVEIDDEHSPRVNERMYSESLSNRQDEVRTAWNLESLNIVIPEKSWPKEEPIVYRALIFPILRGCPRLNSLSVTALGKNGASELSTILQESCPYIEALRFYSKRTVPFDSLSPDPDEQACTNLVLSCPRLQKIDGLFSYPWTLTEFAPRVLDHPDLCQRLEELQLHTAKHPQSSEWMQRLLCSLPKLRVFKQYTEYVVHRPAHLEICDLVRSRWVCTNLEVLHLAIGQTTSSPEDEAEWGPETFEQRKSKIRQVYEQLGTLIRLRELKLCYAQEGVIFRNEFDMTFKTGLKAMEPCLPSLKLLDLVGVENCMIGPQETEWLRKSAHEGLEILTKC